MKIFLSAVSGQFKACRVALRSDLSAVGAEVVVQEDFKQHGASLLEKLERYIASCDRVIALVGDAYGFEPEESARPAGRPRRSYDQWACFFAMGERLDGSRQPPKDIFLYFASPEFLAMHVVSQGNDAAQLQQEFIKELRRSGKDWNRFASIDELRVLVLRDGFQLQGAISLEHLPLAWRLVVDFKAYPDLLRHLDPTAFGTALEKWENENGANTTLPWPSRLQTALKELETKQSGHAPSELWLAWMRATRPNAPATEGGHKADEA